MSLLIQASPPKIEVTDSDGHPIVDTAKSLFHVTDVLTGTLSLNAWSSPPHNGGADHTLGSCDTNSTFVRAFMRASYTGNPLAIFPQSVWIAAGGSFVQMAFTKGIRFWSFTASGGSVKCLDRIYMHEITNEFGQTLSELGAVTIEYYLLVGRFSP